MRQDEFVQKTVFELDQQLTKEKEKIGCLLTSMKKAWSCMNDHDKDLFMVQYPDEYRTYTNFIGVNRK